ncbi:AraC family transcriptional regulator [Luminiphilus sp.]|nr:AraC family transcriptional regulator [Luminiphilus sp.]MDB2615352.1 AraC family transcriptional regulator [Luminiphilus sp.]
MTRQPFQELAVKAFRARLESFGIDPLELIETATLNRNSINHRQEPPSVHEVLETAVTMSGDPAIAIRIGEDIDLAAYGTYGFAIMSSADMGAALDLFLRYGQSLIFSSSWHRSDYEDGLILRMEQNSGTQYQQMLLTELSFSHLHGNSQLLIAKPAEGVRVHLNYPRPKHFEVYEESWAHSIEFDQEHSQIFLPNDWLRQRVRTGDPTTNVLFSQQCEELVSGMTEVDETAAIVRRLLIHSVGNFLSISEVAEQLHVTERTLRRRLAAEGTDFRTIFDDIKNTLARNYLRKTSLSVVEIADLLNYAEATNFHRAFQRWNSTTPADYRQQASP